LEDNPYFSAGFALGVAGTGLAAARGAGRGALTLAQRHLLVTLEVTSKDKSYPWVLHRLFGGGGGGGGALRQHVSVETVVERLANGKVETRFEFLPCPGRHVLRYNGSLLMVERQREQQTVDFQTGQPWESVRLTALGRSPTLFSELLAEAQARADSKRDTSPRPFRDTSPRPFRDTWRPFGQPRRRRPLASVVLDQGIAEHILNDVTEFISPQEWYVSRGIPLPRATVHNSGPPGSGKSSFVAALAGHLGYDICVLNLAEPGGPHLGSPRLTDDRLSHALTHAPAGSLVLLEDPARPFQQDRDPTDRRSSFATFSGLLNALDGVAAGEERLLFMTTNHIER
ncbi:putative mitochondrial chaperone BCS1, partial [Emiliania huxleyi CCMP1516]|uniref:BCS1 N-terminal domain-containing protein n=2 Tax=Emiliania huxleyi TaxID=2903 RepID=A0A0D3KEE5_EMIH1